MQPKVVSAAPDRMRKATRYEKKHLRKRLIKKSLS